MLAVAIPLPSELQIPPVTIIYFAPDVDGFGDIREMRRNLFGRPHE
jgi:hypothetical protein